jgi:hypothetical protein
MLKNLNYMTAIILHPSVNLHTNILITNICDPSSGNYDPFQIPHVKLTYLIHENSE